MKGRYTILGALALALALLLVVSGGSAQAAAPDLNPVCPQASLIGPALQGGELPVKLFMPYQLSPCTGVAVEVPFLDRWANSPHNDHDAEAFRHWDDAGVVQTSCAKCHSTPGYLDFLGADGSAAGSVEVAPPVGSTVECVACHNDVTLHKTSVKFPSGVTIENLGDESRCMECHQGRSSGPQVDTYLEGKGMTADVDAVEPTASFQNIHYFAAAATQYGALVHGGYEYEGMSYDINFRHVEQYDQCYECHDMHTLELKLTECQECHADVESADDFDMVRMMGSLADYDGDGNDEEGVGEEIAGLQALLYGAIQDYAEEVSQKCIVYDSSSHPYWFVDANCDNVKDDPAVNYNAYTARLMKATFNYQVGQKDPGKFAHNGKYVIQLLHDSIGDLNEAITNKVDMSNAHRIDPGHFAGSEEAWRHWDGDDYEVPGSCSKCHSADGIPFLVKEGVSITQEAANGMMCTTCHNGESWPDRWVFDEVTFPNGADVSLEKGGDKDNNLCIQCHQGRAYGGQIDDATAGVGDDDLDTGQGFINVHYFAAGATLFGNVTNGIYEFEGKTYVGQNKHPFGGSMFATCEDCHNVHELEVEYQACTACHGPLGSPDDLKNIRWATTPDYDGDGNTAEGVNGELEGLAAALYAGMQTYATANPVSDDIVYDGSRYPYWFNGSGARYSTWTPRLLRAAYNYQYFLKDPGAFAHNNKYVGQALFDNLEDLEMSDYADGLTTGKTRPQ
ncbi:MAG: hypothetical protein J5I90_01740 [Caldilineales bacterium]|nr:hypothetical protein [Caldilineales bacterium]